MGVFLGKMYKISLYFYFPMSDAIALIKEKIKNKKILCVCPFKLYHFFIFSLPFYTRRKYSWDIDNISLASYS